MKGGLHGCELTGCCWRVGLWALLWFDLVRFVMGGGGIRRSLQYDNFLVLIFTGPRSSAFAEIAYPGFAVRRSGLRKVGAGA